MSNWQDKAACKGMNADVFYPDLEENVEAGIAICQTCSVKEACLDWAITHREKNGTWGGLSQWERRRIRRRASAQQTKDRKAAAAANELNESNTQEEVTVCQPKVSVV